MHPESLPAPLDQYPFHVREALDRGVPYSRLRRKDLDTPYRGVRSVAAVSGSVARCTAFLPLLSKGQWFSHGTAGTLWGLWLPQRHLESEEIHVSAARPSREPRMRGVHGHRVDPRAFERTLVDGLPVTSAVDCWRELSAELTVDELIAVGDGLVRRQGPFATLAELALAVERHSGRRGAVTLARALPQIRTGADSPRETVLRLLLVRAGLPKPLVNLEVGGSERRIFGDLVYPDCRVIVEYDGRHHRAPSQYAADIVRLERLASDSWSVIRVVAEHLDDPAAVAARVARALVARGWRPPRSKLHLLR